MPDFEIKLRFLTNQRRRRDSDGVGGFGVEVDVVMTTKVEPEADIESETVEIASSVEDHLENHNFEDDEIAGKMVLLRNIVGAVIVIRLIRDGDKKLCDV